MTNYLVFTPNFQKTILKGYFVFVKRSEPRPIPDLLAAVRQVERGDGAIEHLEGEDATLLGGRGVVVCYEGDLLAAEVPREVAKVLADVGDAQRDELLLARAQPIVAEREGNLHTFIFLPS